MKDQFFYKIGTLAVVLSLAVGPVGFAKDKKRKRNKKPTQDHKVEQQATPEVTGARPDVELEELGDGFSALDNALRKVRGGDIEIITEVDTDDINNSTKVEIKKDDLSKLKNWNDEFEKLAKEMNDKKVCKKDSSKGFVSLMDEFSLWLAEGIEADTKTANKDFVTEWAALAMTYLNGEEANAKKTWEGDEDPKKKWREGLVKDHTKFRGFVEKTYSMFDIKKSDVEDVETDKLVATKKQFEDESKAFEDMDSDENRKEICWVGLSDKTEVAQTANTEEEAAADDSEGGPEPNFADGIAQGTGTQGPAQSASAELVEAAQAELANISQGMQQYGQQIGQLAQQGQKLQEQYAGGSGYNKDDYKARDYDYEDRYPESYGRDPYKDEIQAAYDFEKADGYNRALEEFAKNYQPPINEGDKAVSRQAASPPPPPAIPSVGQIGGGGYGGGPRPPIAAQVGVQSGYNPCGPGPVPTPYGGGPGYGGPGAPCGPIAPPPLLPPPPFAGPPPIGPEPFPFPGGPGFPNPFAAGPVDPFGNNIEPVNAGIQNGGLNNGQVAGINGVVNGLQAVDQNALNLILRQNGIQPANGGVLTTNPGVPFNSLAGTNTSTPNNLQNMIQNFGGAGAPTGTFSTPATNRVPGGSGGTPRTTPSVLRGQLG